MWYLEWSLDPSFFALLNLYYKQQAKIEYNTVIMMIMNTYENLSSSLLQLGVIQCFVCPFPFMLKANSVSTRLANTRSFSKGTHNQTCVLSSYIKAEVSRSVGLIYIDNEPAGTGFRVGEMYIAACAHIIVEVGSGKSCF